MVIVLKKHPIELNTCLLDFSFLATLPRLTCLNLRRERRGSEREKSRMQKVRNGKRVKRVAGFSIPFIVSSENLLLSASFGLWISRTGVINLRKTRS